MKRTFGCLLILIASGLFALNAYGLTTSLRADALPPYVEAQGKRVITLDEFRSVANADTTDRAAYVTRLTMTLHTGLVHSDADYPDALHHFDYTIPAQENYLLWLYQFRGEKYDRWMFNDAYRAFEKGYGLCSDYSMILVSVLRERGISARIVEMREHVVAEAEIAPGAWWVLDADFGVVVPHSIAEMENNPAIIMNDYGEAADGVMASYLSTDKRYAASATEYRSGTYLIERLSYGAIWLLPILLLMAGVLMLVSKPGAVEYEFRF